MKLGTLGLFGVSLLSTLALADLIGRDQVVLNDPGARAFKKIIEVTGKTPQTGPKGEYVNSEANISCIKTKGAQDGYCYISIKK